MIQEGLRQSQPPFQSHNNSNAHRSQPEDPQDDPQSAEPLCHRHQRVHRLDSVHHQHPDKGDQIVDSQAFKHQSVLAILDLFVAPAQSHHGGQVTQNSHPVNDPDDGST